MKISKLFLIPTLILACAAGAHADWMPSRGVTVTGLTYSITASNAPLQIRSVHFSYQSNQVSTVTFYRVSGSTNYVLNTATGSMKDVWITPPGDGAISLPIGDSLLVRQALTNEFAIMVDALDPRN